MKKFLIFAALIICSCSVYSQKVSIISNDGLSYNAIQDGDIIGKTYTVENRPQGFTIRVLNSRPMQTLINNGQISAIEGVPFAERSGIAAFAIIPNSATIEGTYACGTPVTGAELIKATITVITPGYYVISSDAVDGVRFYDAGYADKAGPKDVKLKAVGIPLKTGSKSFQLRYDNTSAPVPVTAPVNFTGVSVSSAAGSTLTDTNNGLGDITEGSLMTGGNSIKVSAVISTAGYYQFSTPMINGIFYHTTKNLAVSAAPQEIELSAYGIPLEAVETKIKVSAFGSTLERLLNVNEIAADGYTYSIPDEANHLEFSDATSGERFKILVTGFDNNIDSIDGMEGINSYEAFIYAKYGSINLKPTPYGLLINDKIGSQAYLYGGANYVHIFLDELGNSLITSVPQGVPEIQYVVHVIYKGQNNGRKINYGIKPTSGFFVGGTKVENNKGAAGQITSTPIEELTEYTLLIKTADTNIDFEVSRYENGVTTRKFNYTITMTSAYTATISIGLLNTNLKDPSYSIVADPINTTLFVAKQQEGNNRGFGTVFATLYTSPITLIKYYSDRKKLKKGKMLTSINDPVANFQLHSKDYIYMRPVWERIYPTVGIGLTDKIFQNLFFGLNWEFARGGSFFVGGHYGKVNVFNAPEDFKFEQTNLTEAQFNLYKNVDWDLGWAFGASLDFTIIGNLFR